MVYADTLDTTGFTDSAVAAFEQALAQAKAVLADMDATQEQVDAAWSELDAAIRGLTTESGETPHATDSLETTDKPGATQKPQQEDPAQTGDSAWLMLYVAALGVAVAVLSTVTVVRKRRGN